MGRNLSRDEQTIGFQLKHKDKLKISFKKEGDGFMMDALCSDGYTYSFLMPNFSFLSYPFNFRTSSSQNVDKF